MKKLMFILMFAVLASVCYADNYFTKTTFDTGQTYANFTSNTTTRVTLPANSTIINATLDLTGLFGTGTRYVYNETAGSNSSFGCSADATNIFDGDWDTSATMGAGCLLYFTYYKPANVTTGSKLQVKWGGIGFTQNVSIAADCFNKYDDRVAFRLQYTSGNTNLQCDRDGGFYTMGQAIGSYLVYEEGIWWKQSVYPQNVIVSVNSTVVFTHPVNLTGTNTSIDLDASVIQDYLQTNATLPITVTADAWGKVNLTNLAVYYEDLWECDGRTNEHPSYNFTIYDEDNFSILTGDISLDITYADKVLSYEKSNISSLALCIGGSTNYTVSGVVYSDVLYTHKYFLTDTVFLPVLRHVRLYNFRDDNGLSDLQWTTRDYSYSQYKNLIVKMQRYYPENHTWVTVQEDKSGEFGNTVYQIHEKDTDYKMYFYDANGTFLDNTDSVRFVCDEYDVCNVEYQVIVSDVAQPDVHPRYTYDNSTHILTVTWNDPTGRTTAVSIALYKSSLPNDVLICNTTVYSSAGSYECNATGYTGTGKLIVYNTYNPTVLGSITFFELLDTASLADLLPENEGALWTFGLTLTITAMGITGSPVAVIIMALAALFVQSSLGLSGIISISFFGAALVMGLIIVFLVKK